SLGLGLHPDTVRHDRNRNPRVVCTMNMHQAYLCATELDRANFPELRDQVLRSEQEGAVSQCRSYPGYPRWRLARVWRRPWPALDAILIDRRCARHLMSALPSRKTLSRLLQLAHGAHASGDRGPVPSAGGLQALELYLVVFEPSWLPAGL